MTLIVIIIVFRSYKKKYQEQHQRIRDDPQINFHLDQRSLNPDSSSEENNEILKLVYMSTFRTTSIEKI